MTITETTTAPAAVEMVKIVIWDLDETFWRGTLAEDGQVEIPAEHVHVVESLADRGIVSSISSKNHHDAAKAVLEAHGLWDLFVFPRIAFAPKGEAVRQLLADMGLRAANAVFIDDNPTNLAEVEYYNPGIRAIDAAEAPRLLDLPGAEGKPDPERVRLRQYQVLQEKHLVQQQATSNDEFLASSEICIEIAPAGSADAERIHDMVTRTNQLNFTKLRLGRDEVDELLADPAGTSCTVRVRDRFGDYGVVGWYYLRGGVLEHFLFSCRTINMGIEQHVYAWLGHPPLTIVGETAALVGPGDQMRDYIRLDLLASASGAGETAVAQLPAESKLNLFVMSACDLFQVVGRLALPLTEVTFECNTFRGNQRGVNVGLDYLRSCVEMDEEEKQFCRDNFANYSGSSVFASQLFDAEYDYVILSFHDDLLFEQYRHRTRRDLTVQLDLGVRQAWRTAPGGGPRLEPLIVGHDAGEVEPGLGWLESEFECEGLASVERFRDNLVWLLTALNPRTQVILVTAPEMEFYRDFLPDFPLLRERAHELNAVLRQFSGEEERVHLVEINDMISDRDHVTDYVMHLKPQRAHLIADRIMAVIAEHPSLRPDRSGTVGVDPILWESNPARRDLDGATLAALGIRPTRWITPGGAEGLEPTSTLGVGDRVLALTDGDDASVVRAARFFGIAESDLSIARATPLAPDWRE